MKLAISKNREKVADLRIEHVINQAQVVWLHVERRSIYNNNVLPSTQQTVHERIQKQLHIVYTICIMYNNI